MSHALRPFVHTETDDRCRRGDRALVSGLVTVHWREAMSIVASDPVPLALAVYLFPVPVGIPDLHTAPTVFIVPSRRKSQAKGPRELV